MTAASHAVTDPPNRRDAIATLAYQLVAARGLEGFSMRVLAREAGATTGLITHHFLGRAEIIAAALDHATAVMQHRAAESGTDPVAAIFAVLPTDDEAVENWRFALTIRAAAMVDPELQTFDRAIHEHWHRHLPPALAAQGNLSPDIEPEEAVDHLVAVVDGLALRAALDPQRWPAERQQAHVRRAIASLSIDPNNPVPARKP